MTNMDETHHVIGNEGDKSGPRTNVIVNRKLGRSGRRKVVSSRHVTGMHWASYAGEIGPGHYIFDSRLPPTRKKIERSRLDGYLVYLTSLGASVAVQMIR